MTIYFLGGGNMTAAIVAGLVTHSGAEVHIANRGEEKRQQLAQQFGVAVSEKLLPLSSRDVLVLAVKPQDMQAACADVQVNGALVMSVAAGLGVDTLSRYLGGTRRIIRVMPNIASRVGLGVSGMFAADGVAETDKRIAEDIMAATGETVWLQEEAQLHAITGISGSGLAYVFYLLNALKEAAQGQGFDAETAHDLSLATFKGAVALAEETGRDFGVLQQNVTSKGGTTYEAIETFKARGVAEAMIAGVEACVARSQEIAKQFDNQT